MKKIATAIILIFLTLSCKGSSQEKIRIGANAWPGYEPLFVAEALGYFQKNVHMVEYPSASEVLRAFKNNNLEMAALTLDEALYLNSEGYDIKIILVLDISTGGDALLVHPDIKNAAGLKGKKIGVEYTALGAYVLARFLEKNHIHVEEITLVPLEVDRHESAFLSRKVDAVITFEPVKTNLLKKGAHIIFDSSMIPGEVVDVLVVQKSIYERNQKKVKNVTGAWFHVLDELDTNFSQTAKLMFPHLNLTEQELKNIYKGMTLGNRKINEEMLHGPKPKITEVVQKLSEVMQKNKIISKPVQPDELY